MELSTLEILLFISCILPPLCSSQMKTILSSVQLLKKYGLWSTTPLVFLTTQPWCHMRSTDGFLTESQIGFVASQKWGADQFPGGVLVELRRGRLIKRSVSFSTLHGFLSQFINLIFRRGKHCFLRHISHWPLTPFQTLKTPRPLNAIQCLSHAIELACLQIACGEALPYQQPVSDSPAPQPTGNARTFSSSFHWVQCGGSTFLSTGCSRHGN